MRPSDSAINAWMYHRFMTPATIEILLGLCVLSAAAGAMRARRADKPREPVEGQRGKDLVWVPTPPELVEKMLDMARVTPDDYVIDLGSGDGRCVIAAAKRGARAVGIEYDAALTEVSRRNASREGVSERATFVQGDFFDVDFYAASVLVLFLLPDVLRKLRPKFERLKPGTRIVANRYGIPGWEPDAVCRIGGDTPECPMALSYTLRGRARDYSISPPLH
jgi:SAM-dependent methyltransferase